MDFPHLLTTSGARFLLGFVLAIGVSLTAAAGPLLGDTDGDGVDDAFDNCTFRAPCCGPSQLDADGDGCGNVCDCDHDQSGKRTIADFNIFKACFGRGLPVSSPPAEPARTHDPTCEKSDQDGSTAVAISDFNLFKARFGKAPGPSGNPLRDPEACP